MENLLFSLNATMPVFLMMLLGVLFRRIGWLSEDTAGKLNSFVFKALLPVLVFSDLATVDFAALWDTKFVLFCFFATLGCILIAWAVSLLWRDKTIRGEFIQASYRSSAALLGVAFIQNMYGTSGMAPLMMIGSVPLYNIMAVLVLSIFNPSHSGLDKGAVKSTLKGVVTNPILIAIAAGLLWSALRLPMPTILEKTVSSLAAAAPPLGRIAMGATFSLKRAFGRARPAVVAAFLKLVGFGAIFIPVAVALGFREDALATIVVMLGSATTVSGFVMAKSMGHEGVLSSSVVMLTTLLSAFTITAWLWLLRSMGLI
ncbi:MAG: AEC family transporter [Oscillospiraceae bacterium]|nr:AEC family transporter [Oscillospiraceae bacterium]